MGQGLSQPELPVRLGISAATVLNWEWSKTRPIATLIPRITAFLGKVSSRQIVCK